MSKQGKAPGDIDPARGFYWPDSPPAIPPISLREWLQWLGEGATVAALGAGAAYMLYAVTW